MSSPRRPRRRLALQASDQVVRQLDPFERLAEHEFAGMEDERLVVADRQQLGQVGLWRPDIDVRVAVVPEDTERPIEMQIDGRRLEVLRVVRLDGDAAGIERRADVAVGEDAHATGCPSPFSA